MQPSLKRTTSDTDSADSADNDQRGPAEEFVHARLPLPPPQSLQQQQLQFNQLQLQLQPHQLQQLQQSQSQSQPPPTRRHTTHAYKKRNKTTPTQLHRLQSVFDHETELPDSDLRDKLAAELNMTNRAVQVWFQNRRQKMSKDRSTVMLGGGTVNHSQNSSGNSQFNRSRGTVRPPAHPSQRPLAIARRDSVGLPQIAPLPVPLGYGPVPGFNSGPLSPTHQLLVEGLKANEQLLADQSNLRQHGQLHQPPAPIQHPAYHHHTVPGMVWQNLQQPQPQQPFPPLPLPPHLPAMSLSPVNTSSPVTSLLQQQYPFTSGLQSPSPTSPFRQLFLSPVLNSRVDHGVLSPVKTDVRLQTLAEVVEHVETPQLMSPIDFQFFGSPTMAQPSFFWSAAPVSSNLAKGGSIVPSSATSVDHQQQLNRADDLAARTPRSSVPITVPVSGDAIKPQVSMNTPSQLPV